MSGDYTRSRSELCALELCKDNEVNGKENATHISSLSSFATSYSALPIHMMEESNLFSRFGQVLTTLCSIYYIVQVYMHYHGYIATCGNCF